MPFDTRRPPAPPGGQPILPARPAPRRVRQRVWSAGRLLLLIGALAATYGVFFLAAMRVATSAREVAVPNVQGRSIAEASALLANVGLVLKVDPQRKPDPKVPADHVLAQEPAPGSVLRQQRAVRVRVSDGQRDPIVPAVVGQLERAADITLAEARIHVDDRAEIHTSDFDPGTIVAQSLPPGSRASGVSLLINRGDTGTSYVMPDLIGTLGARSEAVLRRLGFRISTNGDVPYPGLPPGIVVRQTPQAGFQIGSGETISLEVSR
jgi:beta-lactam-binding protein with PASTA domain